MRIDAADAAERYFLWWRMHFESDGNPENARTSPAELGSYLGAAYNRDRESRRLFLKLNGTDFIASFADLPCSAELPFPTIDFSVLGSAVPAFKKDDVIASVAKAIRADSGDYSRFFENTIVNPHGEVIYEGVTYRGVSVSAAITNPSFCFPAREDDLFKVANKYLIKPLAINVPPKG